MPRHAARIGRKYILESETYESGQRQDKAAQENRPNEPEETGQTKQPGEAAEPAGPAASAEQGTSADTAPAAPPGESEVLGDEIVDKVTTFDELPLPTALKRAIRDLGFTECTPIQARSLPVSLDGLDVIGKAQTGTGKTAAFLISIFTGLLKRPPPEKRRYLGEPRALVIAPTRELAMQIADDAVALGKYTGLNVVTLVGGIDYQKQQNLIDSRITDIVVATPGRLLDFQQSRKISLGLVEDLVIDEADRMLDMGFIPQVKQIVSATPPKDCRQTMLFSATFTEDILNLSARWTMDPIRIEVAPEKVVTDSVDQRVYLVTADQKINLLYNLIQSDAGEKIIVFSNRRDQVRDLADTLYRLGLDVGMLSGEVAQAKRVKTLENFKSGSTQVLVATDVAGRGLHIDDITHVVNYALPEEAEDYVHRIGRTGRAGAKGMSVSFACEDDSFLLPEIEEKLGMSLPCEHPSEEMLKPIPAFVRPARFKKDGRGEGRGQGRNKGGRRGGSGGGRKRRS